MVQHKQHEPTIMESSETESFTSEKHHFDSKKEEVTEEDDISLDSLFAELKKEVGNELNKENDNSSSNVHLEDYKSIRKSISNLPEIQSKWESRVETTTAASSRPIRIYDPIEARTAKDKNRSKEATDERWFHMKRPELTPEIQRDLSIIKQRQALDPKRHYKREKWQVPKYFEMGTIIESNTGYYNKLTRRERGTNLVHELLNDDNTKKYFKRKYHEIQDAKTSGRKAHYKKVKSQRKKF
ncbi:fcf2 [Candida oxycetoniae]|uniref:Fcf2 n=1 Tax=Candida oxycetoniae TaxID=497107 RepID=A0AAI9SU02_9ASCO|nr:fcf2 [Candida oxycetoniae]KAI3402865.2 fcf2 [Candida oxycetoniae]